MERLSIVFFAYGDGTAWAYGRLTLSRGVAAQDRRTPLAHYDRGWETTNFLYPFKQVQGTFLFRWELASKKASAAGWEEVLRPR